jgi:hypothetical protein
MSVAIWIDDAEAIPRSRSRPESPVGDSSGVPGFCTANLIAAYASARLPAFATITIPTKKSLQPSVAVAALTWLVRTSVIGMSAIVAPTRTAMLAGSGHTPS